MPYESVNRETFKKFLDAMRRGIIGPYYEENVFIRPAGWSERTYYDGRPIPANRVARVRIQDNGIPGQGEGTRGFEVQTDLSDFYIWIFVLTSEIAEQWNERAENAGIDDTDYVTVNMETEEDANYQRLAGTDVPAAWRFGNTA